MLAKGIVTSIKSTKDQCVVIAVSIDKIFIPDNINIFKWVDDYAIINLPEEEITENGGS